MKNFREFNSEKSRNMKSIKILIICIILMISIIIGLITSIVLIKKKEFKVNINDGTYTSETANMFIVENGKLYVSIKEFANFLGYKTSNGEYKKYSEDISSCYIQSNNEVATYTKDSKSMYKKITSDNESEYEYFTLNEEIRQINGKLYALDSDFSTGSNVYIKYDTNTNTVTVYKLEELVNMYKKRQSNIAVTNNDIVSTNATDKTPAYSNISTIFSNRKALLYGLIVTKEADGTYGVINSNGIEVIGPKYSNIKFLESYKEFIVTTPEGKMGIVSIDGTTKIKPEYNAIKQMDKDNGLYIVSINNKYGVINKSGKTILYSEYDQIGIDLSDFENENLKSGYLLYDNCIPVKKAGKWGLMNKFGNQIIEPQYDSIGCTIGKDAVAGASNSLLIPEYNAIVIGKSGLYGLFSASSGSKLIEPLCRDFYTIQDLGKTIYYCTNVENGKVTTYNVLDVLKEFLKD